MKKRTKITLRTKIYLTIVALLALTGVFYAANPTFFTSVPFPTGVAASRTNLLVSEYCTDNIDTVACDGTVSLFATIPGFGSCREKYMAIAPSQSAAAGFTPRDVFVTEGPQIFKITGGMVSLFSTLGPGCTSSDHNGITFDHFGTFGFDMIVTCQEGDVFRIHGDGTGGGAPIASTGGQIEGPAVVPPGFGPHGGKIWVADEANNKVHAIGPPPTYTVTLNILSHVSAEGVFVIPSPPCTFCSGGAFFQAEQQITQAIYQYPLSDFTGLGGNVLVTSEQGGLGADTSLVTFNGTNYVQSSFGPRVPGVNEGSSFVDCDVPTPTPTTTPTPTPTPTPMGQVSQITPTGTTCQDFAGGTAQTLDTLNYSVRNGVIHQVNPGVFFYWVKVTAPAGNNTFVVNQSITTGNFNTLFAIANGSSVFNSSCTKVNATFTQSDINNTTTGTVTVTFNAPTAGIYYIGIKFSPSSVKNKTAPAPTTTVGYSFSTTGVPGSTQGLNLVKSP